MESWSIFERIARGMVRRRKRLALFTALGALVVLLPLAYVISKEPPRYRTSATLLLEARPDRVPVFQELSPIRPLPVQLAILSSRSLAETVVENLSNTAVQELLETSYQLDPVQTLANAYMRWRGIEPPAPNPSRAALAELQRARVTFQPWPDKSGIVTLSAEASRPQVSVEIVNTYIEALMARTRTFNIDDARVSREFLEQQLADVKRTMNTSEQSLQAFVASRGGIRLPDQSRAAADRLATTEATLAEIATSQKMLQTRLDALREKVDGQKRLDPKSAAAALRMPSPEIERMRAQLTQLESSLLDLRTKYTEEHPRIRVVKARIDEIMHALGGALKDSVPANPAAAAVPPAERVNFSEQLIALEATYHSTAAREEALRKQAEALRQSLKGLSGGEAEYARLTRDVESQRSLHALLSDKLAAARIREQAEMKVVKVIDPASPPIPVANPKRLMVLAASLGMSLFLGAGVPAAVEWFHRKIENEDDVQAATGLPVLALIPRVRAGQAIFAGTVAETGVGPSEQLMFTEAFRSLRVGIELGTRGEPLRSLLVTSAFADEGKSTVVVNLGFALNEAGRRIVIADTDFLRPTLHRVMKVRSSKGLVETLESETPLEPSLAPVSEGLWLAQRGESFQPSSRGMLGGPRLRDLISEMKTRADFVICDSSPVLLVPDNLLLAGAVDGVILVAKASSTGFRDLARAKTLLEGAGARILGVVLNQVPAQSLKNYYRRYYESYVKKVRKK
ncbi:MAG TPA: polysaccharide biosynthesis tyrosine autokinase [Methylomirabilota bacterium]|nr:polysaccharide biosynthesis tyrosine autokinase [Methylomirabilota bacterium]